MDENRKAKQLRRLFSGDDLDFYEQVLMKLSLEEQRIFQEENQDFMEDYPGYGGRIEMLQNDNYRGILRRLKSEAGKGKSVKGNEDCGEL